MSENLPLAVTEDGLRETTYLEAIRDAMRVVGSKTYTRFYERSAPDAPWSAVTIDLAKAGGAS